MSILMLVTYCINYYSFTVKFNIYTYKPSNFFSYKRLFDNSGSSAFPYKFWTRLTISGKKKKSLWDFDRVCVECIDQLEESCHLNVYRNSCFFILILYPIALLNSFFIYSHLSFFFFYLTLTEYILKKEKAINLFSTASSLVMCRSCSQGLQKQT